MKPLADLGGGCDSVGNVTNRPPAPPDGAIMFARPVSWFPSR
jgi:hypothetical protein